MWCILYNIVGSLDSLRIWDAARTSSTESRIKTFGNYVICCMRVQSRSQNTIFCVHSFAIQRCIEIRYECIMVLYIIYIQTNIRMMLLLSHLVLWYIYCFLISISLILSMHGVFCILIILWFSHRLYIDKVEEMVMLSMTAVLSMTASCTCWLHVCSQILNGNGTAQIFMTHHICTHKFLFNIFFVSDVTPIIHNS